MPKKEQQGIERLVLGGCSHVAVNRKIRQVRNYDTNNSASIDWAIYALCKEPEEINSNWTNFTDQQKTTIAKFLKFMATVAGDQWVDSEQAVAAYNKTWYIYEKTKT